MGCNNTVRIERTKRWNFHKYKDKASTTCPWHTRGHKGGAAPPKWKSNKHGVKMLANVKPKTIISSMSSNSLQPIDLSQCQIVNPSITAPRIRALVTDSHLLGWLRCQRRLRLNYDGHVAIFGIHCCCWHFHRHPFHEQFASCVMSLLWFDWCDGLWHNAIGQVLRICNFFEETTIFL